MYKLLLSLCYSVLLLSCAENSKPVVEEKSIMALLKETTSPKALTTIEADIKFWNDRLTMTADDMSSQVKLASLYNQRFHYSGEITDVHKSDSLYHAANQLQKHFSSGIYRSLATNCVTQHKFIQADRYLDTAATMGDDLYLTRLQQFDVKLELGEYRQAESILNAFRQKNNFDYYIRASKLEDHKGNSEASISFMEKAYADIKEAKKDQLLPWVKTNLADMYGHNNRISESYQLYTEVVKDHPDYYHAWKGIAWIAYSHDKNTPLAKKILNWLQEQHPIPDYALMLSEIAAFEQNNQAKNQYLSSFVDKASNPAYGDMYNKYLFTILSDELNNHSAAMDIAQKEISNRPTPQSYELLAWTLYKNGKPAEALKIAEGRIINKTFEPDALYHIGLLLKKNGQPKLAKKYLTEALESSFELGPVTANEIKLELTTL